jgi:hypothetical protein
VHLLDEIVVAQRVQVEFVGHVDPAAVRNEALRD